MASKEKKTGQLFAKVTICLTIIILITFWIILKKGDLSPPTWTSLFESLIPELLGPLIAFVILYLTFFRHGIDIEHMLKDNGTKWLEKGYESFNDIDWTPYIESSNKVVVVAFYLEKWIVKNEDSFKLFINKTNSRLTVYLPDYRDEELMKRLSQLIPKYSEAQLSEKIINSIHEIQKKTINKRLYPDEITVYLYKYAFNYTLQAFDTKLFMSINELSRESAYKSPFIQMDLNWSSNLRMFYEQEIRTLEKSPASERLNLLKWKKPN